jgi:hypothetical protein
MAGVAPVSPSFQFFDSSGNPLVSGKLYVYLAGTTTQTNTWQDKTQLTLNTNPIILNAAGRCTMWLDPTLTYKFELQNSAGVVQPGYPVDNIPGSNSDASALVFAQAGAGAVSRTGQAKMREVVSVKDFGAAGDNATNDSAAFQAALDYVEGIGGGGVFIPNGNYRIRNVTVAAKCHLFGSGEEAVVLRFFPTNNAADSTTWTLIVDGAYSSVSGLTIEGTVSGNLKKGNGLKLVPDANGMNRSVQNVRIQNFSGYRAAPTGGTFGVNAEFARSDISDGAGAHLLAGGNGFQCETGSSAWNLDVDHVTVHNYDGVGFNCGNISDSKITNVFVGGCTGPGFLLDQGNKNCQIHNVKVYRCNVLNPTASFATTLDYNYPHELTASAETIPAVVLTGANHFITNFEAQENGSSGFSLGSVTRGLFNSNLHLIADGNGGYDRDASAPTQADYRRYGILGRNYYAVNLMGVCDDFRAKFNLPRQLRGLHLIGTKPTFTSLGATASADWFKIQANSGGANFVPMQLGLASTSNAVGTVFQARTVFGSGYGAATFGSGGILEAVNDRLSADLVIINQYEQDQGTGTGYSVGADGSNSTLIVNGAIIRMATATVLTGTTVTGTTVNGTTINATPVAAGDFPIRVTVGAEANPRFRISGAGALEAGPGGASVPDTKWDRIAAGVYGTPSAMMTRTGLGATGSRPGSPVAGAQWYDTTLSKPIWYDGAAWRDAAGTAV